MRYRHGGEHGAARQPGSLGGVRVLSWRNQLWWAVVPVRDALSKHSGRSEASE